MATDFKPRFNTLVEIFEHSTSEFGDRPLFGVKEGGSWSWMTYSAFGDEVNRVRTGLAGLGVSRGDVVAIISNNRPEWAIAAYAAYGLGAAVVPMYEAQHDENWHYVLGNSGAKVVFVASEAIRARVNALVGDLEGLQHIVVFDGGDSGDEITYANLGAEAESIASPVDVAPGDIAGFVYTSGTTGNPKGVLLTHANLANNVSAITDVFPLQDDDRSLSFLPWAHAFGQTVELHTILSKGCSTAFAESPAKIVENLGEVRPTMLVSVPRIFSKIYDGLNKHMAAQGGMTKAMFESAIANAQRKKELAAEGKTSRRVDLRHAFFDRVVLAKVRERFGGGLKYAISGGAAIPREVALFIDALGVEVYEGYGLSETSPIATANWPGSRRIGSVGKPIPGVRIEIDKAVAADPRDGEIIVYGHNVMSGYHNLPAETAAVMTEDGGFHTGDLGRLDEDGYLHITGRVKEQYKLANGKYVVPTLIEDHVTLSPHIANGMVYGDGRPYNVALIVPELRAVRKWAEAENIELDEDDLTHDQHLLALIASEIKLHTESLPRYEQIREFSLLHEDFSIENGMLTPTLKLKRNVVLERFSGEVENLYSSAR